MVKKKKTLKETVEYIESMQIKNGKTKCYGWMGSMCGRGYPRLREKDACFSVHRFIWKTLNGEIERGKYILHSCKNKSCTNPDHLFISDNNGLKKDPADRKNNRPGRDRLNLDLPIRLVEKVKEMAAKHDMTVTKYVCRRLLEVVRYEKMLEKNKL